METPGPLLLRKVCQQFPYRPARDGITESWVDLRERLEYESTAPKPRMRHDQRRPFNDDIPVKNQVEIEGPCGAFGIAPSAPLPLQFEQPLQQGLRRQVRSSDRRGVQIRRLRVRHAFGFGLEVAGDMDVRQFAPECSYRPIQMRAPIAQVGSQGDGDGNYRWKRCQMARWLDG